MRLLTRWVCSGQDRTRLAETELQLPEQPLALAHAQLDSIGFVDPCRQRLAIPQIHPIPASLGFARNTRLISFTFFSSSRLGRPDRSPSVRPASPCWSKR